MTRLEHQPSRPLLLEEVRDVLKNRQNVQIRGTSKDIRFFLNELIQFKHGKAMIPAKHEEDYTIQIMQNISFPSSDKIVPEGAMRQLLQEFGWPGMRDLGQVQFYFGKLLKELLHDRIIPVILIENPDIIRQKAYRVLEVLSEYTIDRKPVGVPTIVCASEYSGYRSDMIGSCFTLNLEAIIGDEEIRGFIEEVCPGKSPMFADNIMHWLGSQYSEASIKARAKELYTYAKKLGLSEVDYELKEQWKLENTRKQKKHAEAVD
jgi:hypothetical protein